jgi:hypothetical protein
MAKLPKSLIKKYGISKKAWAVFRGQKKSKSISKTQPKVKYMARRRKGGFKRFVSKAKSGFSLNGALKILTGAAVAAAYEIFISPMIPLTSTIKNIVELVIGIVLMSMKGMPMIVRAGGAALATINAYQLVYPLIGGISGGSSGSSVVANPGYL